MGIFYSAFNSFPKLKLIFFNFLMIKNNDFKFYKYEKQKQNIRNQY